MPDLPMDGDLSGWARQLQARIKHNLGLPIAIGLGRAKARRNWRISQSIPAHAGVLTWACDDPDPWLETIAIEDVWGIGRKLAHWCRSRGITNARQLRDMPTGVLKAKAGVVGWRLQQGSGPCLPPLALASDLRQPQLQPTDANLELQQAIATYIVRAAEKLHKQGQRAAALAIYTRSPSAQASTAALPAASSTCPVTTPRCCSSSTASGGTHFQPHRPLAKAGVLMQHLQGIHHLQQHLLTPCDPADLQRREVLLATIDGLNRRYGSGTVAWAACGMTPSWMMRRDRLGQACTTRLSDVPVVRA